MSARRGIPASSPHSSDEAIHATPSTIYTDFSPHVTIGVAGRGMAQAKGVCNLPPIKTKASANVMRPDDPFLAPPSTTTTGASIRTQLSPTAEAFTPGIAMTPNAATPRVTASAGVYPAFGNASAPNAAGPMPVPAGTSTGIDGLTTGLGNMDLGSNEIPASMSIVQQGTFSDVEAITRIVMLENVDPTYGRQVVERIVQSGNFGTVRNFDDTRFQKDNVIVLGFFNIEEAKQAFTICTFNMPLCPVTFLTPWEYAARLGHRGPRYISNYPADVIMTVRFVESAGSKPDAITLAILSEALSHHGKIKAIACGGGKDSMERYFRVEFCDTRSAAILLQGSRYVYQDLVLEVNPYGATHTVPSHPMTGAPRQAETLSATGRTTIPAGFDDARAQQITRLVKGMGGDTRRPPHQYTRIEIDRIRYGADVRTTVMLRNIPNRVTQSMLKELVDNTSRGKYDFMYLRIDFANNCNVGYAFINFTDPVHIIDFALARQGLRWTAFNSEKVAEISYATIQGRENLVQKFRNSSVMLEHPSFRPKLYYADPHPRAGEEERFPDPDNMQKMRRSVENAEHVGLFAPRQGQAYREEQRRRRSQFDRGTPGAELEFQQGQTTLRMPAMTFDQGEHSLAHDY